MRKICLIFQKMKEVPLSAGINAMELYSAVTSSVLPRSDDDQDDLGAPGGGGGPHPGPEHTTRASPASPWLRCRRISDRSCGTRSLIRGPGHSLVPPTLPLQVGVVQWKMATGKYQHWYNLYIVWIVCCLGDEIDLPCCLHWSRLFRAPGVLQVKCT